MTLRLLENYGVETFARKMLIAVAVVSEIFKIARYSIKFIRRTSTKKEQ